MTSLRKNALFFASVFGHTVIDTFNSSGPVIVAFLRSALSMNYAMTSLALGLYQAGGAIAQPIFGWLDDRYGNRWLMGGGIAWAIGLLALAVIAAQSGQFLLFLIPFVLASFGSAAFHPIGVKNSALTAAGRAATFTAFFFLFGQMGLATGPILSGWVLDTYGPLGLPTMALLAVPLILAIFYLSAALGKDQIAASLNADREKRADRQGTKMEIPWGNITVLTLLTFCRSWAQIGTISLVPTLFQEKGWNPTDYGAILSVMWLASAFSGVGASYLADRWGRRQVVFWTMILAIVPLYLLPVTNTAIVFGLALLVGGLTGAPHSIIVVIAQSMLPNLRATASGLILGLIFGMGALATFVIGWLADLYTLELTLQFGAGMALLAALLALALPSTRSAVGTVSETEEVAA